MARGVRLSLVGFVVLVVLAGCARQWFAERETWRHEAEVACLKSGAVKEGTARVRVEPIRGPGICGADFPLKVAALGQVSSAMGFAEELRPPGAVANGQSRWPLSEGRYAPPASVNNPPPQLRPAGVPMSISPPGYEPPSAPVGSYDRSIVREPLAAPPMREPQASDRGPSAPAQPRDYDMLRESAPNYGRPPAAHRPSVYDAPGSAASDDDDDDVTPPLAAPRAPRLRMPQAPRTAPVPFRRYAGPIGPVEVKPAATLACPIVSALDRWIGDAVQPAALRWFGQPVVEIKQISAYSCRGMNGNPNARISEHAFGNALDIAAFILADGRSITVKDGWRGTPEQQGFLHDVQGAACEQFTTVLAPGSNRFHYDHIHVDLMRRSGDRVVCEPGAISGEVAAARARRNYARRSDPLPTGSIGAPKKSLSADDEDMLEETEAATVSAPARPLLSLPAAIWRKSSAPASPRVDIP
jgi:hypothetical protein